jgi:hypothetical protein
MGEVRYALLLVGRFFLEAAANQSSRHAFQSFPTAGG